MLLVERLQRPGVGREPLAGVVAAALDQLLPDIEARHRACAAAAPCARARRGRRARAPRGRPVPDPRPAHPARTLPSRLRRGAAARESRDPTAVLDFARWPRASDGATAQKGARRPARGSGVRALPAAGVRLPRAPVAAHPERRVVGGLFRDPQIFVWSFAWWPHAILHGLNPFFTHAIWEPDGYNLTWVTSVPGLALAFAPVTLLFGPILAYNLASILMPALAAWAAFLLCRRLTGAIWPSLVGGYLFGFSAYLFSAELTHIFTAAVFLCRSRRCSCCASSRASSAAAVSRSGSDSCLRGRCCSRPRSSSRSPSRSPPRSCSASHWAGRGSGSAASPYPWRAPTCSPPC